jgi:hypothetical protein
VGLTILGHEDLFSTIFKKQIRMLKLALGGPVLFWSRRSRKRKNVISRPPVPSHSTLLMALSEIEGPVAGLPFESLRVARVTELREFGHRPTPTKADGFAQGAPKDAHLERTYLRLPC